MNSKKPYYLNPYLACLFIAVSMASSSVSAAMVSGETTEFTSGNGVVERCVRISDFPGSHYSQHDRREAQAYCELDLSRLALCPKLWSTSPGTIIYRIDAAAYGEDYSLFERQHCKEGFHASEAALQRPATFKISVNGKDTSATYAPASWVYYHLSRYFRTRVHVPVAVYRSMDVTEHNRRVTRPALEIVGDRHGLRMLAAGWRFLNAVETGKETGSAAAAALTDEGRQVFGVLLDSQGDRYGAEVNGTRESGWGSGQNHDFQQTAPYLALRSDLPVADAARAAVHDARSNPQMAKALAADTPVEQVVFWMQDVLEITLLDFMLGQQDRIGNIDYTWRWFWVENGKLKSQSAHSKEVPDELAKYDPVRLRQSAINDNDAGVRPGYADFAVSTHMLEGLRHYDPELYQRLGRLNADFQSEGPAWHWMTESAGLSAREAETIVKRTQQAFERLQSDCRSGSLKLDLIPVQLLMPGKPEESEVAVSCEVTSS